MPTLYYVALFLAISSSFCNASVEVKLQKNETMDNTNGSPVIRISLQSVMQGYDHPLHLACDSQSQPFTVPRNQIRDWFAPAGKNDNCFAVWNHSSAYFFACDTNDVGHVVHWLVDPEGFFHSWDNLLNWEKRASWDPQH